MAPTKAEPSQAKKQTTQRPRQNTQKDVEEKSKQDPKHEKSKVPEQRARHWSERVRKESKGDRREGSKGEITDKTKSKSAATVKEKGLEDSGGDVSSRSKLPVTVTTLYLGGIPAGLRVSELKTMLRERQAVPLRLTWQGAQHRAFLDYSDPQTAEEALKVLQDLSLNGHNLHAELAKSQRRGRRSGESNRRQRPSTAPKSDLEQLESKANDQE